MQVASSPGRAAAFPQQISSEAAESSEGQHQKTLREAQLLREAQILRQAQERQSGPGAARPEQPKPAWNTAALNQPWPAASNQPNAEKNATVTWPPAQQSQFQAPRGPKAGQPTATNFNPGYYPRGAKYAGKQQLASRGFDKPIQITRMEWGEPSPNAQDTWGDDEPVPQPLASAMPAEGKPSYRRPTAQVAAFPFKPDTMPDTASPSSRLSVASSAQPAFENAPAKPAVSLNWTRMWTTDGLDHSGDEVRSFLHLSSLPDLKDENGGAGGCEAVYMLWVALHLPVLFVAVCVQHCWT